LIAAPSINKKIEVLQTLSIYQHVTDKKSWFFANRQMSVWPQCVWNIIFSMIIRARNMIFHTHWVHKLIYRLAKNHDFLSIPCWWILRVCKTSILLVIGGAAINGWYMR
jgi:hypothetical protein